MERIAPQSQTDSTATLLRLCPPSRPLPHEQWRRERDNGKVRWILTPVLWGSDYDSSDYDSDYDSEDQSYAFRGRMVRYMCDY